MSYVTYSTHCVRRSTKAKQRKDWRTFFAHTYEMQKKVKCVKTSCAPFQSPLSLPSQHDNLRTIFALRKHRQEQKSRRNIHISARYTLSTRNQWPSLISIDLFKFMSPYFQQWQSSSTSAQKPATTYNSSIRYDEVRTLETPASFPNLSRW